MNLEELKSATQVNTYVSNLELGYIDDKQWQDIFGVLVISTPCIKDEKIKYLKRKCGLGSVNQNFGLSNSDNIDTTLDGYYCNFINSILRNIRKFECDYCYHIYQVVELLRFEPNLKSKLVHNDGLNYVEVWL